MGDTEEEEEEARFRATAIIVSAIRWGPIPAQKWMVSYWFAGQWRAAEKLQRLFFDPIHGGGYDPFDGWNSFGK
ncbi:MAG: hypothetical protein L0Y70_09370 [Gemmataceae bacterium]|nr:hypothetical protein [Gemmataceae bacterium]